MRIKTIKLNNDLKVKLITTWMKPGDKIIICAPEDGEEVIEAIKSSEKTFETLLDIEDKLKSQMALMEGKSKSQRILKESRFMRLK